MPDSTTSPPSAPSGDDVRMLLDRAPELQAHLGRVRRPGELGLAEIRRIAEEVGVPPSDVEAVVSHLPSARRATSSALTGEPWSWSDALVLPRRISEEGVERVLSSVRRLVGREGRVERMDGSVEWSRGRGVGGPVHLRIGRDAGLTRIGVQADRGGEVLLLFGGMTAAGFTAGILLVLLLTPATAVGSVGLPAAGLLVGYLAARRVWLVRARGWVERLEAMLDRAAQAAGSALRDEEGDPGGEGGAPGASGEEEQGRA